MAKTVAVAPVRTFIVVKTTPCFKRTITEPGETQDENGIVCYNGKQVSLGFALGLKESLGTKDTPFGPVDQSKKLFMFVKKLVVAIGQEIRTPVDSIVESEREFTGDNGNTVTTIWLYWKQ